MNNYDTFYTIEYRGHYIHCKYNRDTKKEEFTLHGFHSIKLKSLLSAKQRITKIIGHNKGWIKMTILQELQTIINELIAEAEDVTGYEELESVDDMRCEFNVIYEDR